MITNVVATSEGRRTMRDYILLLVTATLCVLVLQAAGAA
jgi:hypothetical protein